MKFITDDLKGFMRGFISEETDIKAAKSIYTLKVNKLQHCTKWSKFLTKDSDIPARGLRIVCKNPVRA
jgi:hypothetical protein